jgi:hypothetical protein
MSKPYGCDIKGYPLDPYHAWNWPAAAQEQQHERAFARRLDLLEQDWRRGDLLAAAEATSLCQLYRQPPPPWLVDAIAALIDQHMTDAEKRHRRAFDEHRNRWEAVRELRARRYPLREQFEDERGMRWEKIYRHVAEVLGCGEEAVRHSYRLIKAAGGEHATLESYRIAVRQRRGKK